MEGRGLWEGAVESMGLCRGGSCRGKGVVGGGVWRKHKVVDKRGSWRGGNVEGRGCRGEGVVDGRGLRAVVDGDATDWLTQIPPQ